MTASLLRIAGKVLLSLTLAAVVGALVVLVLLPRAVGGSALTVLTGSMVPTIAVGSVVVVQPVDPQTLAVGDVITYAVGPHANSTHRITAVNRTPDGLTFTTKGDANPAEDLEPVTASAVRGKLLLSVPHLGRIKESLSLGGASALLVMIGLVGYALWQLVSAVADRRRARTGGVEVSRLPATGMQLQLLAVTLSTQDFAGLTPAAVARLLRMELLDEGEQTFTLSVVREPQQLDELTALIAPFHPIHSVRSEAIDVPGCGGGVRTATSSPALAPVHVAA